MRSGLLTMSIQEVERITVIKQIAGKRIKQCVGAKLLKLTSRQARRLVKAYRQGGPAALTSKHRGRKSNNRHDADIKGKAKQLIELRYPDFGLTLAAEKLRECHALKLNKETARQWMMESAPQAHKVMMKGSVMKCCKAIGKMMVGPSKSAVRGRFQTTPSGCY